MAWLAKQFWFATQGIVMLLISSGNRNERIPLPVKDLVVKASADDSPYESRIPNSKFRHSWQRLFLIYFVPFQDSYFTVHQEIYLAPLCLQRRFPIHCLPYCFVAGNFPVPRISPSSSSPILALSILPCVVLNSRGSPVCSNGTS